MRIVSLLPSASEIVYALGLDDQLVGVTDECDHPPSARSKPVVSRSALPADDRLSGEQIDQLVGELVGRGEPLYQLDAELVRRLRPDLILAQDLCQVCAVPSGHVEEALATLGCTADVLSLDPGTLDDVVDCVQRVGEAAGVPERARAIVAGLRSRLQRVRELVAGLDRPRTLALEWRRPPFVGGHWVPDMVEAAGGRSVLSSSGEPSRRVGWDEVALARPEVVVFMPCGYDLAKARAEGEGLADEPGLARSPAVASGRVFAVDATSYFSRPSPRILDGLEVLAWALHPEAVPHPGPGIVTRLT